MRRFGLLLVIGASIGAGPPDTTSRYWPDSYRGEFTKSLQLPVPNGCNGENQDHEQSTQASNSDTTDKRGTQTAPLAFGITNASELQQKTATEVGASGSNTPPRGWPWPEIWLHPDWALNGLTLILVGIGFVQAIVFGVQAHRLKQTIDAMRDIDERQSGNVAASIAQATRAAAAMEGMSAAMLTSTKTTTEIGKTQREFGQMQMRAYLSVNYEATVPQDDSTTWRTEVRLRLVNNGHTPAYGVSYQANSGVLPFPLPDDFSFPIQVLPIISESVVGPGQHIIMSSAIKELLPLDQVEEYRTGNIKRVYMWGIAIYTNIFGVCHETRFCQSIVWLRNGNTMGINARRHNEAS